LGWSRRRCRIPRRRCRGCWGVRFRGMSEGMWKDGRNGGWKAMERGKETGMTA
jgi:hypothetical protein